MGVWSARALERQRTLLSVELSALPAASAAEQVEERAWSSCSAAGQCVAACVPDCSGRECGSDGCGGSCGGCSSAQACSAGACVASAVSFADVYAIFELKGCDRMGCHTSKFPAEGLDLSTEVTAEGALVDVASAQCPARKLVLPGDASQSYLVNKLTGSGMCSGSQMPKGATPLNNAQLDTVRAWIDGL